MNQDVVQYFGYAASVFIVLSFVLKDLKKVRLVNLIGCICFVFYGTFNDPILWPIIIPNAFLCFIQVYYLLKQK